MNIPDADRILILAHAYGMLAILIFGLRGVWAIGCIPAVLSFLLFALAFTLRNGK